MNKNELGRLRDEACKAYMELNQDKPARTIGRELRAMYPELFSSIEAGRAYARSWFGVCGGTRDRADKTLNRDPRPAGFIPPSVRAVPDDRVFESQHKWFILSDVHAPFHDERALEVMLGWAHENGCDALYLNGDVVDNWHFSRHFKKPIFGSASEHIGVSNQVLGHICYGFDRVVYKYGNHCDWYAQWLAKMDDPDLTSSVCRTFPEIFQFEEHGITDIVEENQLASLGKLPILHGHEMGRGFIAPVNPARGAFLRITDSVLISHYHRTSLHIEKTGIDGRLVVCRSMGCACQLKASYSPMTKWNHGFAVVEVRAGGNYVFENFALTEEYEIVQT